MRDRVRSCLVRQERNTYLTVCLSLFNLKDCTVGHTGTGPSLLRSAKRFWTCGPLLLPQQWTVARLMGEGRTPSSLDRGVSANRQGKHCRIVSLQYPFRRSDRKQESMSTIFQVLLSLHLLKHPIQMVCRDSQLHQSSQLSQLHDHQQS